MKKICTFMLVLLTSAAHAQDDDRQKIQARSAGFSGSYVAGEYRAMADAYTVDATLMAPGRDIIYGRENIYQFWSVSGSRPAMHRVVSDTLIFSGNVVHDFGYYFTQSDEDGPVFQASIISSGEKTNSLTGGCRWICGIPGNSTCKAALPPGRSSEKKVFGQFTHSRSIFEWAMG